jgi:dihydrofolate reductase
MSVTLDGFVSGPNGEIAGMFKNISEDATAWTVDKILQTGAHLMGRKTFNDMAAYWPNSSEVFAAPMNEIPKIVFSRKGFDPSQKGEPSAARKMPFELIELMAATWLPPFRRVQNLGQNRK